MAMILVGFWYHECKDGRPDLNKVTDMKAWPSPGGKVPIGVRIKGQDHNCPE